MGSVHYISPEQAKGDETDFTSDLYSVGVMMYEMLSGHLPFDADEDVYKRQTPGRSALPWRMPSGTTLRQASRPSCCSTAGVTRPWPLSLIHI